MGSSRSFASTTSDQLRAIHTWFPLGFDLEGLNRAADGNSPDHLQKAHRQASPCGYSPPIACRRMVSGSVPPLAGVLLIFQSLY